MLLVLEPLEVLSRMISSPGGFPAPVKVAASVTLKAARELRVTSPGGTDVTYRLGPYKTISQYGYTDQPGRWDAWPGCFVWTGAYEDGVDGTVVIDSGDMLLPFMRYASSPITLTIKSGYITDISGGGIEGIFMRDFMKSFNDPKAYAVSHIGWGLDDKASWSFMGTSPDAPLTVGQDGAPITETFCFRRARIRKSAETKPYGLSSRYSAQGMFPDPGRKADRNEWRDCPG